MNARQAIERNNVLTNALLVSATEMAKRQNISVLEALDKRVAFYVKYSATDTEAVAWQIRGEDAKLQITQ